RLVNSSTTLTQSFASMDRVFELLDEKYDIVNVPNAVQTKKLNGEIVFDNVSFRYNADEKEILHNLSLTMQPGEKVALVGASGGGKSSLA
ncbi:ATP-binding cassette domain-containing protein, partial [Bacillus mycoides]